MIDETALNIFTDGSSSSSPRAGGTGVRFVTVNEEGNEEVEDFPSSLGYSGATIGQMELQACIEALKKVLKLNSLKRFSKIIIFSDASYVVDHLTIARFQWSNSWNKNKWQRASGAPVLNAEQWEEVIENN